MRPAFESTVVGFGAASADVYRPVGDVSLNYTPGEAVGWSTESDDLLVGLNLTSCTVLLGGNVVNVLSYLATKNLAGTHYAGVFGAEDAASKLIHECLTAAGVSADRSIFANNYSSALSIHEELPKSDPMTRDKPGDPVSAFIDADFVKSVSSDAGVVVIGSFYGDPDVGDSVFGNIPDTAFLTYIPGYREYHQYPERLRSLMLDRNPTLFALNEVELRALYMDTESDITQLAIRANGLAAYVLCTLGENGSLLVHNGAAIYREAQYVDPMSIVDTTGAGDRAAAIATLGLLNNRSAETILEDIAQGTVPVIQQLGATTDLNS